MGNELMSRAAKGKESNIDIVIPTYNGASHISKLLNSIKKQTFRNYNCFVIDDFSKDNTVSIVKGNYPWVHLIEQNENNGPAKNRNIAIGLGKNPYIVIFDDDTYLKDTNWLEKAIAIMVESPKIGQLAAMIVSGYDENILLDCGIQREGYLFGGLYHNQPIKNAPPKYQTSRIVLGACSAGTVLRRNVFEKAGGFDPKYFYPVEDLDLSLRIHLLGYDVIYEPSLVTYHFESQAMGKNNKQKIFMFRRNCLLAMVENYPLQHIFLSLVILFINKVIISPLSLSFRILKNKKRDVKFLFQEASDYRNSFLFVLKNFIQIIRKRKKINRVKTRSRRYLVEIN
jgi:GT2 family glycosyltransferase